MNNYITNKLYNYIMGTRGFFVYRYNNIYYVFYNPYDSYPEYTGLGTKIVHELKQLSQQDFELMKKLLLDIKLNNNDISYDIYNIYNISYPGLMKAIKNSFNYVYKTLNYEPSNDNYIEFIYIIDLDYNIIRMKSNRYNTATFILNNIPNNWLDIFMSSNK